jgi:hypothetical protein
MAKTWKYKLSSAILALLLSGYAPSVDSAPEQKAVTIGRIKWAIYDTATSRVLSNGVREKTLQASDVKIRRIGRTMYDKKIELGDHFIFGLADDVDNGEPAPGAKLPDGREIDQDGYVLTQDRIRHPVDRRTDHSGFGLTGARDDERTFSWDWFVVDRHGHATKLQESGELSFDSKKTPNGIEINHMQFLTDVSIRVERWGQECPTDPTWRIKIFKGSEITWPVLAD